MTDKEAARLTISLMDLTSLGDNDDDAKIIELCNRALTAQVAAVCVWPRFVALCRQRLQDANIRVATVTNFPHGSTDAAVTLAETRQAIEDGANEIDLVMPYTSWLQGNKQISHDMIAESKKVCGEDILLKVILETGALESLENIAEASRDAIAAGADFIKTSTGKTPVSATPESAEAMLKVISKAKQPVGFKAAGGIRTAEQASIYFDLAENAMSSVWLQPNNFRLGASSLLDDCERVLAE